MNTFSFVNNHFMFYFCAMGRVEEGIYNFYFQSHLKKRKQPEFHRFLGIYVFDVGSVAIGVGGFLYSSGSSIIHLSQSIKFTRKIIRLVTNTLYNL